MEKCIVDNTPIIEVKNLKKYFKIPDKGFLHAVDGIDFSLNSNETLGLVGESGCGKSTVGNLLTKLLPVTEGTILYKGKDIYKLTKQEEKEARRRIQMIFQDPYSSLNPKKTIGTILAEPFKVHKLCRKDELDKNIRELAAMVGLEESVLTQFPHELDGGKRQLVGIARALALDPHFIVCDEPVSALDVSVQATIINILIKLQKERNLAYLFISHDLSVVRHISNKVAVMYLGEIVEFADVDSIFENTSHPYSIALLSAVPQIEPENKTQRIILEGDVSSPLNPDPNACRFAARCWMSCDKCREEHPKMEEIEPGHYVSCHFYKESKERAKQYLM